MGSVAGLLLDLQGRFGLAGWQWLFLIEGAAGLDLEVVFFMYLPDASANAKWLTSGERALLLDRVGKEQWKAKIAHTDDILPALTGLSCCVVGIIYFCSIGSGLRFSFPRR